MKIVILNGDHETQNTISEILFPFIDRFSLHIDIFKNTDSFFQSSLFTECVDIIFIFFNTIDCVSIQTLKKIQTKQSQSIFFILSKHFNCIDSLFRLNIFRLVPIPINKEVLQQDFEHAIFEYYRRHEKLIVIFKSTQNIISIKDILYIETFNRHLRIITGETVYECASKLSFANRILKPLGFTQCHQGYIVNLRQVIRIKSDQLELKNGAVIPISRKYKNNLKINLNLIASACL